MPVGELTAADAQARLQTAEAAWGVVDKTDVTAREAVLDRLQSAREAVRVASAA